LEVLRQLAQVEHALADEPSASEAVANKLSGIYRHTERLAFPLPGVGRVQVPMGNVETDAERHRLSRSHMATLLRMQSRGLYTGFAAAMLNNSREPVRYADAVSVSLGSNVVPRPMVDALSSAFAQATLKHLDTQTPDLDSLPPETKTMLSRRVGHRDHGTGTRAVTASWRVFFEALQASE
jgi:hypothetical protein